MSAQDRVTAPWSSRRETRPRIALRWSVLAMGVLAAPSMRFGEAVAQDAAVASAAIVPPTPSVDLSPPGTMDAREDLSPQQRVARAKALLKAMEQFSKSISQQLQAARTARDVVRVLCLNDKLTQVDVALASALDRLTALEGAAARGDADRLRHEYTVVEVIHDRVRVLVDESAQCVGAETGFIADAEVSVTVDPNLPEAETGFEFIDSSVPPPPNVSTPTE